MEGNEKGYEYLRGIGLYSKRRQVSADALLVALRVQRELGVPPRNGNRFTKGRVTLVAMTAAELGVSANYVNSTFEVALKRFSEEYVDGNGRFERICPRHVLEILTPSQFIYLVSADFYRE